MRSWKQYFQDIHIKRSYDIRVLSNYLNISLSDCWRSSETHQRSQSKYDKTNSISSIRWWLDFHCTMKKQDKLNNHNTVNFLCIQSTTFLALQAIAECEKLCSYQKLIWHLPSKYSLHDSTQCALFVVKIRVSLMSPVSTEHIIRGWHRPSKHDSLMCQHQLVSM